MVFERSDHSNSNSNLNNYIKHSLKLTANKKQALESRQLTWRLSFAVVLHYQFPTITLRNSPLFHLVNFAR